VGDAHRRLGLVDVLAAGAGGAVDIDLEVGGIDRDVDLVVHLGRDEHRGEAGVAAVVGIEGRLAHQAVHAGLGLEPAIGVIALDAHGGRLDAGHFAAADFHQLGLPAARLAPAQVHAQQHLGPVLGLGTAGAGLDVEVGIGGIHLAAEHALELELLELGLAGIDIGHHGLEGLEVVLHLRELEQLEPAAQRLVQRPDAVDHLFQRGPFAAEGLRPLRLVPDRRTLQLAADFLKTLDLPVVVKDTPSAHPAGP
jgi:hypothetical protein